MNISKYLLPLALAGLMTACDSCDLEPVIPPVEAPEGIELPEANMTILEFKQQYWSSEQRNIQQIGLTDEGDSIILRGRVVSTDVTGNLYKKLVIVDETAAVEFEVNENDVYRNYPYGAEVVVNVTGLHAGMNQNYLIVGAPESGYNYPRNIKEETFKAAAKTSGWPQPALVQPIEVDLDFLNSVKGDITARQEWQSLLVKVSDVEFEAAGQEFAPTSSTTESRYVRSADGKRLIVRFSGRSSFAHKIIPSGKGEVTGILSFYGSEWQLVPCDLTDLVGFEAAGNRPEPVGDGSKQNPYDVATAMTKSGSAWVKGYIVGAMNTTDQNNYVFEATAPFTVAANVYIAAKPDETNTSQMMPVQLVNGTDVRNAVNLKDNPANIGKEVMLFGSIESYFKQPGIKNTTAAIINGTEIGDGGSASPDPTPGVTESFVRANAIANGKYIIWSENIIGTAFGDGFNYGWLKTTPCTPAADGKISASTDNLFTFTQEAKGWTIADSHGQYLYQSGTYDSFQLSKDPDMSSDYTYWTITTGTDGNFVIVNVATGKTIRFDSQYNSFGAYADATRGSNIYLYQSAK